MVRLLIGLESDLMVWLHMNSGATMRYSNIER